jgi:hypothetical protein
MARQKRDSKALRKARNRSTALKLIDPKLDLGKGLNLSAYHIKIKQTEDQLGLYNGHLADADNALVILESLEKELSDMSDRMLKGVGSQFGPDSNEYQQAGGKRKSLRRRRHTKSKAKVPQSKAA